MRNNYLLLFLSVLLISCAENREASSTIDEEVARLTTTEMKRSYLETIAKDDQKVRGSEGAEIMIKYGNDSEEHKAYIQRQWDQDAINLQKVEAYLSRYGHPDINELGERAAGVPWLVIHHAQGYDVRARHFETIYGAYLDGHIDDGKMSFYLGRMYQIKFHKRHEMRGPFKTDDELNVLIEALDLVDLQRRVRASRGR